MSGNTKRVVRGETVCVLCILQSFSTVKKKVEYPGVRDKGTKESLVCRCRGHDECNREGQTVAALMCCIELELFVQLQIVLPLVEKGLFVEKETLTSDLGNQRKGCQVREMSKCLRAMGV